MLQQISHEIKAGSFISPWIIGPIIFFLWVTILLSVKKRMLQFLRRYLAAHTTWVWADLLAQALSPALAVAILGGGVGLLDRILPLSSRSDQVVGVVLAAALSLALITFADRICRRLVDRLAQRSSALRGALDFLQGGVRGLVIGLGALIFLDSIGISITPLVASLGIGSVAIALALQDTLANLFAGVYMIAEKPVEAGHFIRLESGDQGHVTRVSWRSTHIRTLSDTMIVVPNSKLAGSVITNFSLPQHEFAVTVDVGVDYNSDLEQVEQVTLEIARVLMMRAAGAVPGFEPRLRYHAFGDSSINFTVWLGARDFVSGMAIKHEFIKRLHEGYRSANISVPFPTRALNLTTDTILRLREIMHQANGSSQNIRMP